MNRDEGYVGQSDYRDDINNLTTSEYIKNVQGVWLKPDDTLVLSDEPVPAKPLRSFRVRARITQIRDRTGRQHDSQA